MKKKGASADAGGGAGAPLLPFRSIPELVTLPAEGPSDAMVLSCETTYKLQREIGESFWLAADATPQCGLEALAATIFKIYSEDRRACAAGAGAAAADTASGETGAEWWVQIRGGDSPDGEAIGTDAIFRNSRTLLGSEVFGSRQILQSPALSSRGMLSTFKFMLTSAISVTSYIKGFHWDRDEVLADEDPPQLVHPSVATVTYLTGVGAPTMVIEQPPLKMPTDGRDSIANAKTAFLSQPAPGKHIAFDGRLLHGVPPEMMLNKASKSTKQRKRKRKRQVDGGGGGGGVQKGRRITFLVNMWFNGKPTGIKRYPTAAARKHPLTRAGVKPLVPWETVPGDGPIVPIKVGKGQQCGFAFGRPEDEAHEMWLPIAPGSFGTAGQSVGLKYSGTGITIKRKPPDLAARRRLREKEKKEAEAAAAIKAASAAAATPATAMVGKMPSAQKFEDEDWDSSDDDDDDDENVAAENERNGAASNEAPPTKSEPHAAIATGNASGNDSSSSEEDFNPYASITTITPPIVANAPLPATAPLLASWNEKEPPKELPSQKKKKKKGAKKMKEVPASTTVFCSDAGWAVEPC